MTTIEPDTRVDTTVETPARDGVIGTSPVRPDGIAKVQGWFAFSSDLSLLDLRRGAAEEVVRVLTGEPARHPRNAVQVAG